MISDLVSQSSCPQCQFVQSLASIRVSDLPEQLLHILSTNEEPRDNERHDITRLMSLEETDLAELDRRITRLKGVLDGLLQIKERMESKIQRYRCAISSVRRLPLDVLQEIFSFTAVEQPADEDAGKVDTLDLKNGMRWRIVQVSRAWRRAALSLPRLWCRVSLDWRSKRKEDNVRRLLELQLERSSARPLLVTLCSPALTISPSDPLLSILPSTCQRWQELTLDIPLTEKSLNSLFWLSGSIPCLQRLIIPREADPDDDGPRLPNLFAEAPSLHTISGHAKALSLLALPTAQVLRYQSNPANPRDSPPAVDYPLSDVLTMLRQYPQLQYVSVACQEPEANSGEDLGDTVTHSMTNLVVSCNPNSLLAHLRAPSLQCLTMTKFIDSRRDLERLRVFFSHSGSCLRYLEIIFSNMNDAKDVIAPFERLAALEGLVVWWVTGPGCRTEFVQKLVDDPETYMPSLRWVKLWTSRSLTSHDFHQLRDLLKARPQLTVSIRGWEREFHLPYATSEDQKIWEGRVIYS